MSDVANRLTLNSAGGWALLLLVVPRFFVIPMHATGIRTEDIILVALAPSAFVLLQKRELGMSRVISAVGAYFGVVLASALAAAFSGQLPLSMTLAFGLRPLFYVSAFVLGYRLGLRNRGGQLGLARVAFYAAVVHLAYGAAVAMGIAPNMASFGPARLSGLTNGPYELSAMFCVIFILCNWSHETRISLIVCAFGLLWTQARIAVAALFAHLLLRTFSRRALSRGLLVILFAAAATSALGARTGCTQVRETVDAIAELREEFAQVSTSSADVAELEEYLTEQRSIFSRGDADGTVLGSDRDASAVIRIARWSMVVSTAASSLSNLLVGMGPGYYSVALDGNYVRLVGETGLLGLVTFLLLVLAIRRSYVTTEMRKLVSSVLFQYLVIAIFIDIFVSLRAMVLLWMVIGAAKREEMEPQQ